MSLPKERIVYLLEVYTSQKATVREEQELMNWIQEAREDSELKTYMENLWKQYVPETHVSDANWDKMFDRIIKSDKVISIVPEPRRIRWTRIVAAAAVLIILASGAYLLTFNKNTNKQLAVTESRLSTGDVAAPAVNKATLTLGNGKVIILDSTGAGSLEMQGARNARKVNDEELVYTNTASAVEYHTLHVPKGSKPMEVQLADGSQVWLNAASSITFPTRFSGDDRRVSITGEAYFEVSKNAGKKFLVSTNATTTEVLGTHFNINAYGNEPSVKITLLEGSVRVNGSIIQPGQQALSAKGRVTVVDDINIEQVMAWKNGMFEFNETDIQTIMRQIERWYDVEVVFDGTVTQHFNGTIQRQVNASKVLGMLEKTGGVRFSIEGKKVLVKKY